MIAKISALFLLSISIHGSLPSPLKAKDVAMAPFKVNVINARVLVAQARQPRSDRVVGYWTSSSGAGLILAYTGRPSSLWIQVYTSPGRSNPRLDYTATWINDSRFSYVDSKGSTITGQVHSSGRRITVRGADGWSAEWNRRQ